MGLGEGAGNRCERRLGGNNDLRTYRDYRARSGYRATLALWLEIAEMTMAEALVATAALFSGAAVLCVALVSLLRR